jgi:hypothetical protein
MSIPSAIRQLDIPAAEANYVVRHETEVPMAGHLIGITPHAHLLCKEIKVDGTLPDGKPLPLIWIKDWDFNWQGEYQYVKPVNLPSGTKLAIEFKYDNSADNPAQPSDPPRRVTWGEQTTDEMAIVFYQVLVDPAMEDLARAFRQGRRRNADGGGGAPGPLMQRLLNRYDKNKDGKLDDDERKEAGEAFRGSGNAG